MRVARLVVAFIVAGSGPASADDSLDKRVRESGHLITDGNGHYIAFLNDPGTSSIGDRDAQEHVWWGDGKTFYQFTANPSGDSEQPNWYFDDKRVGPEKDRSVLYATKDGLRVRCQQRYTTFTRVPADETRMLLKKATLKPPRLTTFALAVARDGTTYYVLDLPRGVTEKTKNKARLFVGKRGALKPQKVTRIEGDDSGTTVTTAAGVFWTSHKLFEEGRSGLERPRFTSTWKPKRGDLVTLSDLDRLINGELIYSELGIYPARHGVPCDDL